MSPNVSGVCALPSRSIVNAAPRGGDCDLDGAGVGYENAYPGWNRPKGRACGSGFGGRTISRLRSRLLALRPRLATGLPLSAPLHAAAGTLARCRPRGSSYTGRRIFGWSAGPELRIAPGTDTYGKKRETGAALAAPVPPTLSPKTSGGEPCSHSCCRSYNPRSDRTLDRRRPRLQPGCRRSGEPRSAG